MRLKNVIYISKDSFFLGRPGNWIGFHTDHPWSEDCKLYGAPPRIYVHFLAFGVVSLILPSKYDMDLDHQAGTAVLVTTPWRWGKDTSWSRRDGYRGRKKSRRLTFRPGKILQCQKPINTWINRLGEERHDICGASRWHRGLCAGILPVTWFETNERDPRPRSRAYSIKTS